MRGSIFKRCGCRDEDGKQLGPRCPKLRRKDGSWNPRHGTYAFVISVPGKGGKRERVPRGGFTSLDEAERERDRIRERLSRGLVVNDQLKCDRFFLDWLASKADVRPSTLHGYKQHVTKYLIPELGHLRLTELRVSHVFEALAKVTSSDANRQRVRATLRSALSDAVRQGLIATNPAALVKLPSGKRPKALVWTPERVKRWQDTGELPSAVMVWTPAQLGAFLDTATSDRLYALFHLVAHRGLRRGEACGIEWADVDLDAGQLAVRRQLVQVGWDVVEGDPKSDAGGRTIALDAGTVVAMRTHRREQLEERLQWGAAWVDSGKVFTREDGSALHPESVTDRFHALSSGAGLPPTRLHDLRHCAASIMLAAGVDPKVVSETLGHSTLGLTMDTYTSVYTEVATAAAEAAAALIPRSAGRVVITSASQAVPAESAGPGTAGQVVGRVGFEPTTFRIMSRSSGVPDGDA